MRCRYVKDCELYHEGNQACSADGGMYYSEGNEPAGCYRRLERVRLGQPDLKNISKTDEELIREAKECIKELTRVFGLPQKAVKE